MAKKGTPRGGGIADLSENVFDGWQQGQGLGHFTRFEVLGMRPDRLFHVQPLFEGWQKFAQGFERITSIGIRQTHFAELLRDLWREAPFFAGAQL